MVPNIQIFLLLFKLPRLIQPIALKCLCTIRPYLVICLFVFFAYFPSHLNAQINTGVNIFKDFYFLMPKSELANKLKNYSEISLATNRQILQSNDFLFFGYKWDILFEMYQDRLRRVSLVMTGGKEEFFRILNSLKTKFIPVAVIYDGKFNDVTNLLANNKKHADLDRIFKHAMSSNNSEFIYIEYSTVKDILNKKFNAKDFFAGIPPSTRFIQVANYLDNSAQYVQFTISTPILLEKLINMSGSVEDSF